MGIKKVQDIIIELLTPVAPTSRYFGEFKNPKDMDIPLNMLPLIKVDLVSVKNETEAEQTIIHNIYIAHISYSKSENTRANTHKEIYDLIEQIDQIFLPYPEHRFVNAQKIYDNVGNAGYLTIFQLQINTKLLKDFS